MQDNTSSESSDSGSDSQSIDNEDDKEATGIEIADLRKEQVGLNDGDKSDIEPASNSGSSHTSDSEVEYAKVPLPPKRGRTTPVPCKRCERDVHQQQSFLAK